MFKERLTKLRKNTKLTQGELAKKLGIPRTTYSNYENGNRQPDYETLLKIAEFFDVSTDYLIGAKPKNNNNLLGDEYGNITDEEREKLIEHLRYLRWVAEQDKQNNKN